MQTDFTKQYILYGASFNPPHMGHFYAIQQMLEDYDKVIIFPYPHKRVGGDIEEIVPLKHRMKMLELFLEEFFPQIQERLVLVNLSSELNQKDTMNEGFYHTYDYLKYLQTKVSSETKLNVCLGIDAQNKIKDSFYKEEEIKKEFGIFYLQEEKTYQSDNIRNRINSKTLSRNVTEEFELISCLGYNLYDYVKKNKLYEKKRTRTKKL